MIVLDIETSGLDSQKCGIWQIGAIEFENPKNQFLEEARIDPEDEIINDPKADKTVYEITGKTEKDFRNPHKQIQKQLIANYFNWVKKIKIKTQICQNPQFDLGFIATKAGKYEIELPFHHRAFDLHSIASLRYHQTNERFFIEKNHSGMSLTKTLEFCGIKDNRQAHNALEDAKLTAECFSRIVYGKNLLPEFKSFPIPDYVKK